MIYLKIGRLRFFGYLLLSLYLIQWCIPLKSSYIIDLQASDDYKFWSGLVLFALLLSQWVLTYSRVILQKEGKKYRKIERIHKFTGAISPLFYFIHSANPTYGFLLILTVIFMFNQLIANLSLEKLSVRQVNLWVALHIFLSMSIIVLAIAHVVIVFQYK